MTIRPEQRVRPEVVLDALMNQQARVAGDIVRLGAHTWALHGVIPLDGDVIIGEFDHPDAARAVLDRLAITGDDAT